MSFQSAGPPPRPPSVRASWMRLRSVGSPARAAARPRLAVLLYANALDNPFVYDDFRLIVENPSIQIRRAY